MIDVDKETAMKIARVGFSKGMETAARIADECASAPFDGPVVAKLTKDQQLTMRETAKRMAEHIAAAIRSASKAEHIAALIRSTSKERPS